jgi:hypothetical protein
MGRFLGVRLPSGQLAKRAVRAALGLGAVACSGGRAVPRHDPVIKSADHASRCQTHRATQRLSESSTL